MIFKLSDVNLIISVVGIYSSYFVYGICQETLMTTDYGAQYDTEQSAYYTFTFFLLWVQCAVNYGVACLAISWRPPQADATPSKTYALLSAAYISAMWLSNLSLQFIDYPTQALGKSIKPVAVMIVITLLVRKAYPLYKWLCVLAICCGICLFSLSRVKGHLSSRLDDQSLFFGRILIFFSLIMDGVTAAVQEQVFAPAAAAAAADHHAPSSFHIMRACNLWAGLYLFIAVIVSGEAWTGLQFVTRYPRAGAWLLLFSCCSAIGQMFIYWTIKLYSALVCSVITTTRKFFTLLISVAAFGHELQTAQWAGVFIVFGGLLTDSYLSARRRRQIEKELEALKD